MAKSKFPPAPVAPGYLHKSVWGIDPGLQGTGYAHLEWTNDQPYLWRAGVLNTPSAMADAPFWERAMWFAKAINELVTEHSKQSPIVVCEMPQYFDTAATSMGWKKGDLQKLVFLVGTICAQVSPFKFYAVEVNAWKGQLPKQVVEDRMRKRLGTRPDELGVRLHAWDAIGIGMWAMGRF
jgi:Holliday junction resolvasome RuvABC endonuclease subunit